MSVLLIFIDGIGIGEHDPNRNPFARHTSPFFSTFKGGNANAAIPFDGLVIPTDPTMGVQGLPQSATGQTAILTGRNAAQILGRHLSGFPTESLRAVIQTESVFLKVERLGKTGTFANAFAPRYFKRPDRIISATTWSLRASNFPFKMVENDLLEGRAVSHDITNEFLSRLGIEVPIRTPEESGEILAQVTASVDFCLFEYFLTDLIGHGQDMEWAGTEIDKLNRFLHTVLSHLDLREHLVLLTSDHGNFEDLSVVTHTRNFVPTMLWGKGSKELSHEINRIEDITPTIIRCLSQGK